MPGKENDTREEAILGCIEALYRTAFRLTGNQAQAEDLVQETYLRTWRSLSQLHSIAGVQPWMFRILRTVITQSVEEDRPSKRVACLTLVKRVFEKSDSAIERVRNSDRCSRRVSSRPAYSAQISGSTPS